MAVALLTVFVVVAVICDVTRRKIPNLLVGAGVVTALLVHWLTPAGIGVVPAVLGMLLGFGLMLPLYLLRAMGAGDVKLIAMVGAFVGVSEVVPVVLATLVAGGLLAVAVTVAKRSTGQLMENLRFMGVDVATRLAAGRVPVPEAVATSVGKLPYAIAIAAGTFGWLGWKHWFG